MTNRKFLNHQERTHHAQFQIHPRCSLRHSACQRFVGAGTDHTFVSRTGDDANNCSAATPCRTFNGAEAKTNAGGDITALVTGRYGVITIDKALTIQAAPGVDAALPAGTNQNSVTVNAGSSDTVVIRNLSLVTVGNGVNGIRVNTVGALHVEGCVITGFTGSSSIGINFASGSLFIHDTTVRNNGFGIAFGGGQATIDHCRIENNNSTGQGFGLGVSSNAKVTITDSVVAGHAIGLSLQEGSSGELNVERCTVSNNSFAGISIESALSHNGIVRVSNSTVTNNGIGFDNSSGTFQSRGNNMVRGNGQNTKGTITVISGT